MPLHLISFPCVFIDRRRHQPCRTLTPHVPISSSFSYHSSPLPPGLARIGEWTDVASTTWQTCTAKPPRCATCVKAAGGPARGGWSSIRPWGRSSRGSDALRTALFSSLALAPGIRRRRQKPPPLDRQLGSGPSGSLDCREPQARVRLLCCAVHDRSFTRALTARQARQHSALQIADHSLLIITTPSCLSGCMEGEADHSSSASEDPQTNSPRRIKPCREQHVGTSQAGISARCLSSPAIAEDPGQSTSALTKTTLLQAESDCTASDLALQCRFKPVTTRSD